MRCLDCGCTKSNVTSEGTVCTGCGTMFGDFNFDYGPEYRQFGDGPDMTRVGAPNDPSLGTLIADNNGPLSRTNKRVWSSASSTPRPTPPGIVDATNLLTQLVHLSDEMEVEIKSVAETAMRSGGRHGARWCAATVAAAFIEVVRGVQVGDMSGDVTTHLGVTRSEFYAAQDLVASVSVGKRKLHITSDAQQEIVLSNGLNKMRQFLGDKLPQVKRTARVILTKSRTLPQFGRDKVVGGVAFTACMVVFRSKLPEGLKIDAFQRAFDVSSTYINIVMKDLVALMSKK